jgi:hypothetical protein
MTDDDFDFGFSAVSEEELKALEKKLQQEVTTKSAELAQVAQTYEDKLNAMYKMIMPLLKNLAKDDKKEYIFWPNRSAKMQEFIKKIDALMK